MVPSEFAKTFSRLCVAFGKPADPGMLGVWLEAFGHLDADDFRAAASRCIATARWMPSIAEVSEAVVDVQDGTTTPAGAFAKVLSYIGSRVERSAVDALALDVADQIGWRRIEDDTFGTRALFLEMYGHERKTLAANVVGNLMSGKAAPRLDA